MLDLESVSPFSFWDIRQKGNEERKRASVGPVDIMARSYGLPGGGHTGPPPI